jgi:hypothetical protein
MKMKMIFKLSITIILFLIFLSFLLFFYGGETIPEAALTSIMNVIGAQFFPFKGFVIPSDIDVLTGEIFGVIGEIIITIILTTAFYEFLKHIDISERMANRKLNSLSEHIIITPINDFSIELAKKLKSANVSFLLVDTNRSNVIDALGIGLLSVNINGINKKSIDKTMFYNAKYLILLGENEIDNVITAISIRSANPDIKIISRAKRKDDMERIMAAGANDIILPEQAIGDEIGKFFINAIKLPGKID